MKYFCLITLMMACQGGPEKNQLETAAVNSLANVDADGDGFTSAEDCDDNDASIHPAADEVCDELDNNCDGQIDEFLDAEFYADLDGDGFGTPEIIVLACSPPSGFTDNDQDCNDDEPLAWTDAPEVCDGVDNNCDGIIDEDAVDLIDLYLDEDGDGYGQSETVFQGCAQLEGYASEGGDCDDSNALIFPDAAELCDELDNNCNEEIDENLTGSLFYDEDGDGYGDPNQPIEDCDPSIPSAPNNEDCDDSNAAINPSTAEVCDNIDNDCSGVADDGLTFTDYYTDADNDGFGDANTGQNLCEQPNGTVTNSTDCDDSNANINPNESEVCNGIDDDCSGVADDGLTFTDYYTDSDNDGFGDASTGQNLCEQPSGTVTDNSDCDDSNANTYPSALELCDGLDNDCNGDIDDNIVYADYYIDSDGDGFGDSNDGNPTNSCLAIDGTVTDNTDCDDSNANINPNESEVCNGIDDDCSGVADDGLTFIDYYTDSDNDGFGDANTGQNLCEQPSGTVTDNTDCDDGNANIYPSAPELCDGFDNDCDNDIDESLAYLDYYPDSDADGFGAVNSTPTNSCLPIDGAVTNNSDCDDSNASINPNESEVCNGIDDDCSGVADDGLTFTDYYTDSDNDGFGDASTGQNLCEQPSGTVTDSTDCDDNNTNINPDAIEVCDNIDNNCDTQIDEGLPFTDYYADGDNDGFGDSTIVQSACTDPFGYVTNNTDCDDSNANVYPNADEYCDGLDNDCDNNIDGPSSLDALTSYLDSDSDGYGNSSVAITDCSIPTGYVTQAGDCNDSASAINPGQAETCDGFDNNCNSQIDEGLSFINYYADTDNDGFGNINAATSECSLPNGYVTNSGDCDDNDFDVNPNADEYCDGIDNNCDNIIDGSDSLDALTYYFDDDEDGFGDDQDALTACAQPSGYILQNNDCDDSDPDINPNASEICNGQDDDCDNQIDEGLSFIDYYADTDNDGFGNINAATSECSPPNGYVTNSGDCDDGDFDVNPDADEYCDGIDNDCDNIIDEPDSLDADIGFLDLDGDGFGGGAEITSCEPLVGSDGDCNDADFDINPDAVDELDGIDNNCDGDIDEGEALNQWCTQENYNGSSYQFCEYVLPYEDILITGARNRCIEDGYHLVIIDDSAENGFLGSAMGTADWWIGLEEVNNTWQWIDGTAVTYSNYASSFNTLGGRGYFRSSNTKWYSGYFTTLRYFICEANP